MDVDPTRLIPIKLVIFDVDGVLTDGRIVMDDNGLESKFFSVRDGHGLKLLMWAGIEVGILTGRKSRVVDTRAADLGIRLVHQGIKNKIEIFTRILDERSLSEEQTAYAGDDLVDLPVMRQVGLAMAPADAIPEVKAISHFVCSSKGGHGAAREMAELILKGQGRWQEILSLY